jgi:hypothetical protein
MNAADDRSLAEWLLEQGGPTIRYRAAAELFDDPAGVDVEELAARVLATEAVRSWLQLLDRPGGVGDLHSSNPGAFENAMGKLFELGVGAGMPPLDAKTGPFRRWLAEKLDAGSVGVGRFYVRLVTGALARSGYCSDGAVRESLLRTLGCLYRTAREGSCDIWLAPEECRDLPKACQGKPLIRPEFVFDGETPLPLIHDMYGFSGLPPGMLDAGTKRRIAAIIGYILRPEFQALPDGYGYFLDSRRRQVWAHGWGVRLPGTSGFDAEAREGAYFLQRLELMAHFPRAAQSQWFRNSLRHLEGYRTDEGTYRLPARYLREQRSGYYVTGAYMGLGESRRSGRGIEIESTFRVLLIRRLARGAG